MSTPTFPPKPVISNQDVIVNCLHTALGTSWATLNDGNAGMAVFATGEAWEVVSSSANDAAAGTGVQTWGITYLNTDGEVATTSGSFNGVAAVATGITAGARLLDFWCATYGSGDTNAGNLTIQVASGGAGRGYIAAGRRRAALASFTVPDCHNFHYRGAQFSNNNPASGTPLGVSYMIEADIDPSTGEWAEGKFITIAHGTSGLHKPTQMILPDKMSIRIPQYATIRARGLSGVASTEVSGIFFGKLVADRMLPTL